MMVLSKCVSSLTMGKEKQASTKTPSFPFSFSTCGMEVAELKEVGRAREAALAAFAARHATGLDPCARAVQELEAAIQAAAVAAEELDAPRASREALRALEAPRAELVRVKSELARMSQEEFGTSAAAERQALLGDRGAQGIESDHGDSSRRRREILEQASLLETSRDLGSSLKRIQGMLAGELKRLGETEQILNQDAQRIQSTNEGIGFYGSEASKSDAALKEIERQEKIDYLFVAGGFIFFLCVVAYIIFKRTAGHIF